MSASRLSRLLARIDQLNAEDPNKLLVGGVPQPHELVYSQRLTSWVLRLDPQASEWLRIAARAQHIQRWTIPRASFPRTTAGYLRWRETLKAFHARSTTALMREEKYDESDIDRVCSLILKRSTPGQKAELQTLEDALCLLFIETQLEEVKAKIPDSRLQEVVQKTWAKMSPRAHDEALKLPMSGVQRAWLAQAVVARPW